MDREKIDELIIEAGLEDIVTVFNSAIEINVHLTKDLPMPGEEDGYRVLARLIDTALSSQVQTHRWISCEDWQHDYRKANLVYIEYVSSGSDKSFARWVYDKMVEKDNSLPAPPEEEKDG